MREVDIAIEAKLAGHSFAIGIEYIDRKRPAPVTWIEGIHDRNQTLEGLHKTVAVSRSGFTKPALVKAERYNIDTITLQEAEESDWVERARQLLRLNQLGLEVIVGVRKGAKILVAPPSGPPYPPPPQLGNQDETMLYDPTGKPLATVAQVGDEVFSEPEVWEKIAQEVAPNTWFAYGDERLGQGRENAKQFLKENDDVRERILADIYKKLGREGPKETPEETAAEL